MSRISSPVVPARRIRLGPGEKARLGAEIVAAYVAVRWWLLRAGLPEAVSAARRIEPPAPFRMDQSASLAAARRLGGAVERILGAMPFDSRCLIRSLVLVRILARRGLASRVVLGVRAKPSFSAHAWVEYAGVPLLATGEEFERLAEM